MKIIFLCGSLEPGRDGVGDYSRHLAAALIRRGHPSALIALHDKNVDHCDTISQQSDGVSIPVLRLSAMISTITRYTKAADFITAFNPDWISLQYVPFSFHDKGLHYGLGHRLLGIGAGRKWHIMFHELWVGRSKGSPVKSKVLSYLQQIQIRKLAGVLKPALVHTHLPIYQLNLKKIGIAAGALPLFSNIRVVQEDAQKGSNTFRVAFFSQVDASGQMLDFINQLSIQVKEKGLLPELMLIGGDEKKMTKLAELFQNACPFLTKVSCTGFLDEQAISQVIAGCNLGITPVPLHGLGKSGSIAAFLAHGVPVAAPVVLSGYSNLDIGFFDPGLCSAILLKPCFDLLEAASVSAHAISHKVQLSSIVKTFLSDITK